MIKREQAICGHAEMEKNYDLLRFDADGLIPAVVQDHRTGRLLTLAYMNRESLDISMREKRTCFFSRSRNCLWRKGESSGNVQSIVAITADCEYNSLLVSVIPHGPACHTGDESCFRNPVYTAEPAASSATELATTAAAGPAAASSSEHATASAAELASASATEPASASATEPASTSVAEPAAASSAESAASAALTADGFSLDRLYELISSRKADPPEGSYTAYLFEKGLEKILKKVGEESAEVIIAAMSRKNDDLIFEVADLCYHILVLLCEAGVEPAQIIRELSSRHKKD